MKKQITKKGLLISIITWTLFILVYLISLYELNILCRVGRVKNSIVVLFGCALFFLVWVIGHIIRIVKKIIKKHDELEEFELKKESTDTNGFYTRSWTIWICAVSIFLIIITCFYGVKIYHSATNFNGKLSWVLNDSFPLKFVAL